MGGVSLFTAILALWVAVTVVFGALLLYRYSITSKEEDQVILDPAESRMEEDQKQIVSRLDRLAPYVKGVGLTWLVLFLVIIGFLFYRGYQAFVSPAMP